MTTKARLVKRKVPKHIAPKGFVYDLKVGKEVRARAIGKTIGMGYVKAINKEIKTNDKEK
jgi:hypothetical protein